LGRCFLTEKEGKGVKLTLSFTPRPLIVPLKLNEREVKKIKRGEKKEKKNF